MCRYTISRCMMESSKDETFSTTERVSLESDIAFQESRRGSKKSVIMYKTFAESTLSSALYMHSRERLLHITS